MLIGVKGKLTFQIFCQQCNIENNSLNGLALAYSLVQTLYRVCSIYSATRHVTSRRTSASPFNAAQAKPHGVTPLKDSKVLYLYVSFSTLNLPSHLFFVFCFVYLLTSLPFNHHAALRVFFFPVFLFVENCSHFFTLRNLCDSFWNFFLSPFLFTLIYSLFGLFYL